MLDDLAKTVKAQLYERVSSPLLGAFAISWIVWNYRFLLVLASSMPALEKFDYIDTSLFSSYQVVFLHGALYPLLTTLALIFIYPTPAKFVYEYWRKRQRELKEIQQRIDDESPLTQEEARELRRETLKARLEFEQELERKSAEISRLTSLLKEYQPNGLIAQFAPPKSIQKKQSESDASLDEAQIQMLRRIAEAHNGLRKQTLISGDNRVVDEFNLGELNERGYVIEKFNSDIQADAIYPTHQGRSYLVKNLPK